MYLRPTSNQVLPSLSARSLFQWLVMIVMVSSLFACAGTASKTGVYVEDSVITTKVKSKLLATKNVSGTAINVETHKGVVQLSGFVKSKKQKEIAVAVAKGVTGVKKVINSMQLKQ